MESEDYRHKRGAFVPPFPSDFLKIPADRVGFRHLRFARRIDFRREIRYNTKRIIFASVLTHPAAQRLPGEQNIGARRKIYGEFRQ